MTYDAVLVARRGLGPDDLRLIDPAFAAAVRWTLFVEKAYENVPDLTSAANIEVPGGLSGQAISDFWAARNGARDALRQIRTGLLLDDVSDG